MHFFQLWDRLSQNAKGVQLKDFFKYLGTLKSNLGYSTNCHPKLRGSAFFGNIRLDYMGHGRQGSNGDDFPAMRPGMSARTRAGDAIEDVHTTLFVYLFHFLWRNSRSIPGPGDPRFYEWIRPGPQLILEWHTKQIILLASTALRSQKWPCTEQISWNNTVV